MNWKKFKSLSPREKIQWIFQYYGLTMAVVAAVIFVGAVFLSSVFGPGDNYAIRVMILDDRQSADICRVFGEELGVLLSGECDITGYTESGAEQMQAYVVRLMTDDLDLVIAPAEVTDELLQNGFLRSAAALSKDSRYHAYTDGGSDRADTVYCIGETTRSRNADRVPAAIDYFTEQLNEWPTEAHIRRNGFLCS